MSSATSFDGYCVRRLEERDIPDVLSLLRSLTCVDELSSDEMARIFHKRNAAGIITKVIEESSSKNIVATASLLVEQKFTRGGKCVGHIEDVVTNASYRGKGFGRRLLDSLYSDAESLNCYKLILDCNDEAMPFYEKEGFVKGENQMRKDIKPRANDE